VFVENKVNCVADAWTQVKTSHENGFSLMNGHSKFMSGCRPPQVRCAFYTERMPVHMQFLATHIHNVSRHCVGVTGVFRERF
jgi:hypothetical protein